MADAFHQNAEDFIQEQWSSSVESTIFGQTSLKQDYCMVLNKAWSWSYEIFLITANPRLPSGLSKAYKVASYSTEPFAIRHMKEFERKLSAINPEIYSYNSHGIPLNSMTIQEDHLPREEVIVAPDRFLIPGDAVLVEKADMSGGSFWHHAGIYAGNSRVYHYVNPGGYTFSTHATGTSGGCCLESSWDEFLKAKIGDDFSKMNKIARTNYILKVKTPEEIIETAQKLIESKWGESQYQVCNRNCQHFAALCAVGHEFSIEIHEWARRFLLTSDRMSLKEYGSAVGTVLTGVAKTPVVIWHKIFG